jgi:hypothetical protein
MKFLGLSYLIDTVQHRRLPIIHLTPSNKKEKLTMKTKRSISYITVCGLILFTLLSIPVQAQKAAPVTVVNTTQNPVPVQGSVQVTNTPSVQIDPNANTVKLDPATNVVKLDPSASNLVNLRRNQIANVETFNWTGQTSVFSFQWAEPLAKARMCVAHTGANAVVVNVNSVIGSQEFTIDSFQIASPNTVCRVYDIPGSYLYVTVHNVGSNNAGLVRVGYWGIY